MSGAYGDRSLKETPTWAVALVSAVFVIISILIEHGIHSLGKGKIQLISQSGVHQLHIFIFLLGVFHILYSVIGMALAQAKLRFICKVHFWCCPPGANCRPKNCGQVWRRSGQSEVGQEDNIRACSMGTH